MSHLDRLLLRLLVAGAAPAALGACTMVNGPVGIAPAPRSLEPAAPRAAAAPASGAATDAGAADRIAAGVVEVAMASIGTPYEWGGTDENGFDCSGLIQFAYARYGIALPRTSAAQIQAGAPVQPDPSRLRPGDVLGFSGRPAGKTSHVGLYIGAGEFIHSSSSGVRVSTLRNPYWQRRLVAARRILQ